MPAAQIGMHHVPLNWTGPDDGHFNDKIVEAFGTQARQHGHLRPGLHLEDADAVALLQQLVGAGLLRRNPAQSQRRRPLPAAKVIDQVQGFADGGEHAEAKHIDLEQAQGLQIILSH